VYRDQRLAIGFNFLCAGFVQGQRGHFQHHTFGFNQLQVATGQRLVCAIDKNDVAATEHFAVGIGEQVEQQGCIAGGTVVLAVEGTVKQLVAKDGPFGIQNRLAGNAHHRWFCGSAVGG